MLAADFTTGQAARLVIGQQTFTSQDSNSSDSVLGGASGLAYAEAITWDLPATDELWDRLHKHFSEPELVEIGYFVAITMGQQRWLRTLNIEHHQILAGTDGSMAPGFETLDALQRSKMAEDYWAKIETKPSKQAAE